MSESIKQNDYEKEYRNFNVAVPHSTLSVNGKWYNVPSLEWQTAKNACPASIINENDFIEILYEEAGFEI